MNNPEQKIEVTALSALMALQSVVHVFTHEDKLSEFIVEGIKSIPGCGPSSLCFRNLKEPVGDLRLSGCSSCFSSRAEISDHVQYSCLFEEIEKTRIFYLETSEYFFGRFLVTVDDRDLFSLYEPFLLNLISIITVTLENRIQKNSLERSNRKLLESERNLTAAQRISHLGSWVFDIGENRLRWSDEIFRIFGVPVNEFESTYESFLSTVHPDDRELVDAAYSESVLAGTPYHIVHRIILPDGAVRFVEERCDHQRDENGTVIQSTGTVQDITDRVLVEQELKKHRDHLDELVKERTAELEDASVKLKEMDRMKSMFIATMSHELRTPLNSIIGFTTIVLDGMSGEINDQQRDHLGRVAKSSKHLLAMVSDIIDISNIEAGRLKVEFRQIIFHEIVAEAVDLVRVDAEKKGLLLATEIPSELAIVSDPKRLLQCLINLLSNAVKFSEHGTIQVVAKQVNDAVQILVSDAGIGIAQNDIARIFEPFERLQSHMTVKAGGTGLGLYLTRKLMTDVLQGTIEVESVEGKGSVFMMMLPRVIKVKTDER